MEILRGCCKKNTILLIVFLFGGFYAAFQPFFQNRYSNLISALFTTSMVIMAFTLHRTSQTRENLRIRGEKLKRLSVTVNNLQHELQVNIPIWGGTVKHTPEKMWEICFPILTYTTPGVGVTHYHLEARSDIVLVYSQNNRGVSSLVISRLPRPPLSGTAVCS